MNEQSTNTQTTATKPKPKKAPLTTAQRLAALEAKKQKLVEQSRREETRKKIIFGAAMAGLLVEIIRQEPQLANNLIKGAGRGTTQKDRPLFDAMIGEIREKAAKKIKAQQAQRQQTQTQAR